MATTMTIQRTKTTGITPRGEFKTHSTLIGMNLQTIKEARIRRLTNFRFTEEGGDKQEIEREVRRLVETGKGVTQWKNKEVGLIGENGSTTVSINVDGVTRLLIKLGQRKIIMIATSEGYATTINSLARDADEERAIDVAVKMIRAQILASYDKPEITTRLQEAMGILIIRNVDP